MVNYGKSLRNARRQEWEDAYLDYDRLKTALYRMDPSASIRDGQVQEEYEDGAGEETPLLLTSPAVSAASSHARDQQERLSQPISAFSLNELLETGKAFLAELHTEIEKVTLFSLKKQGEIADQVGSLRFEHYSGKDRLFSGTTTTAALSSSPEDQACEAYARVGVELLHLLRFICINATGIHKILKKYEKTVYAVLNEISPNFEDDVLETTALQQLKHALDTTTAATRATPILKGRKATAVTPRTTLRHRTHKRQPTQPDFTTGTTTMSFHKNGPGSHLQELANSASIAAIHASLGLALQQQMEYELQQKLQQREPSDSLLRFHFVMASIETLRHSADLVNSPFSNFLSRKAMIATGANLGGMEASTLEQLRRLLMFEPDIILNLPYEDLLDWYRTTIFEDDRDAGFGISIRISDPVAVMSEQKSRAAGHRRKQSHLESMHTMSAFPSGVSGGDKAWGGVDSKTLTINLLSTLLYTVNYYIVAPNANRYAVLLGQDGAYGATLIGASSFAALFAAFVYSFWYTKASFRSALIFSSLCALIGNLLYALAISYESMSMALWGRILCGFGSAEVVNRQLISTCVSFERLTRASAFFVAVGAAGMSIGPLLGSIFDMISGRDSEVDLDMPFMPAGGIVFDHVTLPGFFMAGLWMLQMCLLLIFFLEPERINVIKSSKNRILTPNTDLSFTARPDDHEQLVADLFETKAGATTAGNMHGDEVIERNDEGSKGIGNICWLITSEVSSTAKLIVQNPGLPVTLILFCFIELADEVIISSCSIICKRYFGWHGSTAGLLIASLGALVLPADFVVERASHYFSERKIMKHSIVFIIATLIGIANFEGLMYDILGLAAEFFQDYERETDVRIGEVKVSTVLNKRGEIPYDWDAGASIYVVFLSATFMGTIILEGVVTSLMAKVTPAKLNDAFINSGLLATLIGTLGRVFADLLITMSAFLDVYVFIDFVNATFAPLLLFAIIGYYLVQRHYRQFLIGSH